MENDTYSVPLCLADWQTIIDALYESTSERLTRADIIGLNSTYGAILYNDAQKIRAVADYIEFYLPESDND